MWKIRLNEINMMTKALYANYIQFLMIMMIINDHYGDLKIFLRYLREKKNWQLPLNTLVIANLLRSYKNKK